MPNADEIERGPAATLEDFVKALEKRELARLQVSKVNIFHFNGDRVSEWLELLEQVTAEVPEADKFKFLPRYVSWETRPEVMKVAAGAGGDWAKFKAEMQRRFKLGDGLLTKTDLEMLQRDEFSTVGAFATTFEKMAKKVPGLAKEEQCATFQGHFKNWEASSLTKKAAPGKKLTWAAINEDVMEGELDQISTASCGCPRPQAQQVSHPNPPPNQPQQSAPQGSQGNRGGGRGQNQGWGRGRGNGGRGGNVRGNGGGNAAGRGNEGWTTSRSQGGQEGGGGAGRGRVDWRNAICWHCGQKGHTIKFCHVRRNDEDKGLISTNYDGDMYDKWGYHLDPKILGGTRKEAMRKAEAGEPPAPPAMFRIWQEKEVCSDVRVEEVGENAEVEQERKADTTKAEPIIVESDDEIEEYCWNRPLRAETGEDCWRTARQMMERMEDLIAKVGRYQQKLADICDEVREWKGKESLVYLYDLGPGSQGGSGNIPNVTTSGPTPRSGMTYRPPSRTGRAPHAVRTRAKGPVSPGEPAKDVPEPSGEKEVVDVPEGEDNKDDRLRKEEDEKAEQRAKKRGAKSDIDKAQEVKKKRYAVRVEEGFDVEEIMDRILEGHNHLMNLRDVLASAPRLRNELRARLSRKMVASVRLGTIIPKEAEWAETGTKMDWKSVACGCLYVVVKGKTCTAMVDSGSKMNLIKEVDAVRLGMEVDRSDNGVLMGANSRSIFIGTASCVILEIGKVKDLQRLNAVTVRDTGGLPNADALSEACAGRAIISLIDLYSGYDQFPVYPSDRPMTAMHTPRGLIHMNVAPQGWTNAVAMVQRHMVRAMQPIRPHITQPYIDDLAVKGPKEKDEQEVMPGIKRFVWDHVQDLCKVLDLLEEHNLTASGPKSRNCMSGATILGFVWLTYIWMFDFELERIPGTKNRADGLSRVDWDKNHQGVIDDTPPVDGFLDSEEDVRLHINSWALAVGWMMELALAGKYELQEHPLTIENGALQVGEHKKMIGGVYLLANALLQEETVRNTVLDQEEEVEPGEGDNVIHEREDDDFEEREIKEAFRAEKYEGDLETDLTFEELLYLRARQIGAIEDRIEEAASRIADSRTKDKFRWDKMARVRKEPLKWTACLEEPRDEDTLPSRQEYLKPYDIIPHVFYSKAEEVVIDDDEEDNDEETSEEGSYSEYSEGELSEEEEEEEEIGSEWEALPEEAARTGTEAEDPEAARKREEIATRKRQLELASGVRLRISDDPTKNPEPPKPEDGDPAAASPSTSRRRWSRSPSSSIPTRPPIRPRTDAGDRPSSSDVIPPTP
ncbi:hypothetical protein CBR_g53544 [Chara braunii]|uniref:CCHC-type domain-containing protein n=1 Tax=Chara braunii TaxID=69332 RepID=A0A388MBA3_CHABU|nr:hypothetical protein CBR_g53544 [Chara braunii]|eukprot:GBG91729.1 hypothetical protein CBR_g53544 [Chara braunii]